MRITGGVYGVKKGDYVTVTRIGIDDKTLYVISEVVDHHCFNIRGFRWYDYIMAHWYLCIRTWRNSQWRVNHEPH